MYNAKGASLKVGNVTMDYISFGRGSKNLLILPGLSDGLKTVRGTEAVLSYMYRKLGRRFRVVVLSRRNELPANFSIADMAEDVNNAMSALSISSAFVLGVSMGGMIAMELAASHTARVQRLILTVTAARANDTIRKSVSGFIECAEAGDYHALMVDTAEHTYSEHKLRSYRRLYPFLRFGAPKSYERFFVQANACLNHDASAKLGAVSCPTMILGGSDDKIVGVEASFELSSYIKASELYIYDGLGHGLYEEAVDFLDRVLTFCEGEKF